MANPKFSPKDWGIDRLRLAIDAACVALWAWNVNDDAFAMDPKGFDLWGIEWAEQIEFEKISAQIHPADRDRVRAAFNATRSVSGPYEIDFRIVIRNQVRWVSARGRGADEDIEQGMMYGIFLDVTGRKQAEEGHELLAGEMSHRVKNLLAIATSLTMLTSRSSQTLEDMTTALTRRLIALGRAHDLIRPLPGSPVKAALLGDLITILLAPYDDQAAFSGRIRVSIPRLGVGERSATALAMVMHELATNSVKHGALSNDIGTLDISGEIIGEHLKLVWAETGGPPVGDTPELTGFGSRMMVRCIEGDLRGSLDYDWQESGLVATASMQMDLLAN
jgi:two-component sensor histidine kinase